MHREFSSLDLHDHLLYYTNASLMISRCRRAHPFFAVEIDVGRLRLVSLTQECEHGGTVYRPLVRDEVIASNAVFRFFMEYDEARNQFNCSRALLANNLAVAQPGKPVSEAAVGRNYVGCAM